MNASTSPSERGLVEAATCESLFEARLKQSRLEDAGLKVWVFEPTQRGFAGASVERPKLPVPVYVRPEDLEQARAVLATAADAAGGDEPVDEAARHAPPWARMRRVLLLAVALFVLVLLAGLIAQLLKS